MLSVIPCSGAVDEVVPCKATVRRNWKPLGTVCSRASSRPAPALVLVADLPEFMEFRRSRRLRLASSRRWLCIARRRSRSSIYSLGSEDVRSRSDGGAVTAAEVNPPGCEQIEGMEEDRTRRGFFASCAEIGRAHV